MKKESSEQQIRALRKFVRMHKPTLPAMSAPSARKPAPVPGGRRTTRSEAAKLRAEKDLDGKVLPTIKFDSKQNEDSTESTDSQSEKQNTHSIKSNESQCRTNENQCKTSENQMESNSHQETAEERSTKKPRKKRISRALFRHDNIDYIKPKKQEMLQKTFSFTFKKLVDKSIEIYSKTDDQPNSEENEIDKNKEILINDAISDTTNEVISSQNIENPVSSSLESNAQSKRLQHLILDMPSLDSPNAQSEHTQTEFSERNKTNTCSKQNTVTMAQRNAPQKKTNLSDTLSAKTPAVPKNNVCHIETNSSQYLQYPFYGILHNDQNNTVQGEQLKTQSLNERQMRAQQQQMQVQQTIEEQLKRQQFEKQLKAQQMRAQQPEQQMKAKQTIEDQIKMQQLFEQQLKQMTAQQPEQMKAKQTMEDQIKMQQLFELQLKQMTEQQTKQRATQQSIQEQMKAQHEEQIRAQQLAGKQLIAQQPIQEQKRVQQYIKEQLKRQQTKQAQQSVEEQIPTFQITVLNPQQPQTNEQDNNTFSPRFPLYPSYPQYLLPPQYQKILEKQHNHNQLFPEKMYPIHQAPPPYFHPNNPYRFPGNPYIYPYLPPPPYPHHLIPKQRQIWNPQTEERNNKNLVNTGKETVNETEKKTTEDNNLKLTPKSLETYRDNLRKREINLENINSDKLNFIRHTHEAKNTQQLNPNCTIVKDTINQQKLIRSKGNSSDKNQSLAIPQEHQENNRKKLKPQLAKTKSNNFITQIPTVHNILHRFRNHQELHEKQNENIPQGQKRSGSPTVKTTKKRVSFNLNLEDKNNLLCSNNYANSERGASINQMPNTCQTRNINKPEIKIVGPEERSAKESVIVSPSNHRATAEQQTNEEKKLHLHNRNNNNILFMQDKNHTPAENNKIMQCSVIKKVCTENKNKHSIENILSNKCSTEKRTFEVNNNKDVCNYRNDKNIEAINLNDNRYVKNITDDNLTSRTVIKNHKNDLKIKSFEYETIQNNSTPCKISKRRKTLQHIDLTYDSDQDQHNSFTLEQQFKDNISLNDKHTLKNRCGKNTQAEQKMNSINDQKHIENVEINMPKLINKRTRVETTENNKTQENSRAAPDNHLTIDSRVNNYACNNVPFPKPAHSNNKVTKTIETTLPLNLSLKNDAQKTNEPSDQNKRQSIIVNNKRSSVSGQLDTTKLCFVKNDEEYEGYLKLLKEKNAVGPYLFYEFVAKVRKRNNQPVFDLVTFFLLLKQGKLLEYKIMYNQCNKNN